VTDTAAAAGGVSAAGLALAVNNLLRKYREDEAVTTEQV